MNENTLKNLNNLTRILGADRLLTPEDVTAIKEVIVSILANNKKEIEGLTEEAREVINGVLNKIKDEHDTYLKNTEKMAQEVKSDSTDAINKAKEAMKEFEAVKALCKEVMENKPKDGEDADEEKIVADVLAQIKLPEYKEVMLDDGGQIVDKINALPVNEENQIDASHIKNLPKVKSVGGGITQKRVMQLIQESGSAGVTLKVNGTNNVDQGTLDLIEGSGMTITDNGDGTVTFESSGGSGTPGGSNTQLQYNNAGSFGGISGATTDGTATTYTTGNLKAADVKASGSGGISMLSNAGTQTALFGAGGGANNTFYGDVKLDYTTATTVPYIDASKNLISSAVTPTELGYLSGVTSAIQTQLNGKQNTLTNPVTGTGTNNEIAAFNSTGSTITSLTTATYPSLTELSYVKGVTSSIQTQLNAKGAGSVTSIDVSGGTTGLTFTGGPVTTSGTITAAGTLAVANGGTGQTSYTNGQLLIGNTTGNTLTKATLTGTSNQITVTNGGGSITLSTPQDIATTSNPQFASVKTGYIADTNGNEEIIFTTTASAVNEITVANAATGNNPNITASGSDSNIGLDFTPKGTGSVNIKGNSTQAGQLRIYEDTDDGSNYTAFKVGTQSGNVTYTLPTGDGSSGQFLSTNGSGVLSWATGGGGGSFVGCRIYKSAGQSIGTTLTAVTFDTESFDTDTMHDNVTNNTRITFTTAGYYEVNAQISTSSNAVARFNIKLNDLS